jgi:divalent metal cation (Fe/Co/Zn/Cd) transporter
MYSFHKIKTAAAMLMVGFLLAIAFTATAQAGGGTRQGLTAEQWKAVQARAQAMDRYYHLGSYSVIEASSPFQWSDAGIGAGAMLGTILVAGGLALVVRRRGRTSLAGIS